MVGALQVGRARPSLFYRCFPDGVPEYKDLGFGLQEPICHPASERDVIDGFKSFPSGHTSLTTSGLFFLTLFLLSHANFRHARLGSTLTFLEAGVALSPLLLAVWVGCTRVSDYAHNYTDVGSGFVLGVSVTWYFYFLHTQMHAKAIAASDQSQHLHLGLASMLDHNRVANADLV